MKRLTAVCVALIITALSAVAALAEGECRVVTLMYHDVSTNPDKLDEWCVSPRQLEEDINYFTDNGYITVTASELVQESMENLEGKKILLLTFDDGYVSWYNEVYPILKRTGAKATMFIVGAYINRYGFLSEYQIHELANSGLIEIGNHTDRVHQMPRNVLEEVYEDSADDVMMDIRNNGSRLSRITGKDIVSLAWPYGYSTKYHNRRVENELGYKALFTTDFGVDIYDGNAGSGFYRVNRDTYLTTEELYEWVEKEFENR